MLMYEIYILLFYLYFCSFNSLEAKCIKLCLVVEKNTLRHTFKHVFNILTYFQREVYF